MASKKKTIPKVVKILSWEKWIGEDVAKAKCLCCETTEIKLSSFHCGHVISEANGGSMTVDNLRPICSACNLSMKTENMDDFKKRCGFGIKKEVPKCLMSNSDFEMIKKRSQYLSSGKLVLNVPFGQQIYYDHCSTCKAYYHNAFDDSKCPCCKNESKQK